MQVDEAVREVNAWAEKMTNGLIKGIVSPNSFNTKSSMLVLANALYFKGAWVDKFYPERTKHNAFFLMDGSSSVRVPFMSSGADRAAIGTYDTFKVLNLPYRKGKGKNKRSFSMSIFLPNDRCGLPSLLQRVCTEDSTFLDRHIPKEEVDVGKLRVPKFKIEVDFTVLDVLEQLGLKIGMLTEVVEETQPVIVSKIVQKVFVEVNEEGTKAAAVTYKTLYTACRSNTPVVYVDFIADHPFMFVIREDSTGLVLFVGQVLDPAS